MYIELHAGPLDGRSIATELAELRKSQHFEEKTQFLLNTLYYVNIQYIPIRLTKVRCVRMMLWVEARRSGRSCQSDYNFILYFKVYCSERSDGHICM